MGQRMRMMMMMMMTADMTDGDGGFYCCHCVPVSYHTI